MSKSKTTTAKVFLKNKFKDGYGEYLLDRRLRILYFWEIGTFGFKDRFLILTPSDRFIHRPMSGSRSWHDELEFISELKSLRKIRNF